MFGDPFESRAIPYPSDHHRSLHVLSRFGGDSVSRYCYCAGKRYQTVLSQPTVDVDN